MRNLLNNFWVSDLAGRSSNSYMEVTDLVHYLQDSGTEVQVQFEDDTSPRLCTISAFNKRHKVFVIDLSSPLKADEPAIRGQLASIITIMNGQRITFKSQYHEPFLSNDNSKYQLNILSVKEKKQGPGYFCAFFEEVQSLKTRLQQTAK